MAKRRGHGEGSIFKRTRRGRVAWVGEVLMGRGVDGKVRRRTVYGRTRGEVVEKLDELRTQVKTGRVADPGRLTVEDLVDRYLEHKKASVRPRTLEGYASRLRGHVVPRIGGVRLRNLQPIHVLDFLAELERECVGRTRRGEGARTRQNVFDLLKRVLDFGVKADLLDRNPAAGLDRPKSKTPEVKSLAAEQAKALLSKAAGGSSTAHAATALGLCGLRRGEVFGLTWGDVDLKAGTVRVRQQLVEYNDEEGNHLDLAPLKTKAARRTAALPPFAHAALTRHREALEAAPLPGVLVFRTGAGTPMRASNFMRREWRDLTKAAGVPTATFHQLRHTAATLLLGSGVDIKATQAVLGHAKASHTIDIYADAIPSNVDAAMARLGDVVESGS